jgi:hypothetical protein
MLWAEDQAVTHARRFFFRFSMAIFRACGGFEETLSLSERLHS